MHSRHLLESPKVKRRETSTSACSEVLCFCEKYLTTRRVGTLVLTTIMVDPRLMQLSLMSRLAHPWRMVFLPALQCPLKPIKPFKLLWQIVWFRPGSNCLGIMIVGGFKHEWCSIFRKIPWVTPQAGVGVGGKIYLRYNYELHPTSAH